MTAQDLKNSILQQAIQGKLLPQNPADEPASELLKKISAERQKLIDEGKIKNPPQLPPISDDEKAFDIPNSWQWVRLSDILDVRDGTHDTPQYVKFGVPLVTSKNLSNGTIDFETAKFISQEDADLINIRSLVEDSDILFAMIGTVGNPTLVKKDREFCIKNMALFKAIDKNLFNMKFFLFFLSLEQYAMKKQAVGGVQSFVSLRFLRNYLFPLPPLAEQKRIVEKLEEILPLVERYDELEQRLTKLDKEFPDKLKKSLLQQAIQGKLTEQLTTDGDAKDLLEKIRAEKSKLISEGKIKKEKPLPPISAEEIPFDIPENWQWVRLGEIVYSRQQKKPDKKFSYIDIGSINNACQKLNEQEKILSPENAPSRARKPVKFGDVIYATVRPYLHNVALIDKKFGCEAIASTGFAAMVCLDGLLNKYLLYYLISPTFDIYANAVGNSKGMAYPAINDKTFYNAVIALPPLAEQKRIVERLEELLPLCDRLKEKFSLM